MRVGIGVVKGLLHMFVYSIDTCKQYLNTALKCVPTADR